MRRFRLVRHKDLSGISGTGHVADGVEFTDGTVVLNWLGEHATFVVLAGGVKAVLAIHGHGGATTIDWTDVRQIVPRQRDSLIERGRE